METRQPIVASIAATLIAVLVAAAATAGFSLILFVAALAVYLPAPVFAWLLFGVPLVGFYWVIFVVVYREMSEKFSRNRDI